jgi:N-acetylglutamate synthase-like GNAT family acetyltransferase
VTPSLRLATNDDGKVIQNLCRACGFVELDRADWTDIAPFWVVAEQEGRIVGALQVCDAKPVGRLEFMAVNPMLPDLDRSRVARLLGQYGDHVLKRRGIAYSCFHVAFEDKAMKRALKRRGAVVMQSGNLMLKRCA